MSKNKFQELEWYQGKEIVDQKKAWKDWWDKGRLVRKDIWKRG